MVDRDDHFMGVSPMNLIGGHDPDMVVGKPMLTRPFQLIRTIKPDQGQPDLLNFMT